MEFTTIIIASLIGMIINVDGITWKHRPNTQRCLREELRSNVLVIGDYSVQDAPVGQNIDVVAKDSKGQILAQKDDIATGRLSFVTEHDDTFEICFISILRPRDMIGIMQEISLDIRKGIEASIIMESAPWKEALEPLDVELKRLEDLADEIVRDFYHMKKREEEMRDTNESTSSRVLYLGIFSMCCLLGLAAWQVLYLRRYFKSRKLIE